MAKKDFQRSIARTSTRAPWWSKAQKGQKAKDPALQKALKEHWDQLPEAFKAQCAAMGMKVVDPPAVPDLPTLIKEHLQSLPPDLKEAVEKLVAPDPPEPPLASKVKQAVGTLKQLTEKKAALQTKADTVKAQYTQLLQDLKELQGKIEVAQKELQSTTTQYNQELEKEKQDDAEEKADDLSPEALITAMAGVSLQVTSAQVKDLASKLVESAVRGRQYG